MSKLEIKIGEGWKWDAEYLQLLRGEARRADRYAIQDAIEIVVDGIPLTSRIAEDSVLYILSDLAAGLLALAKGEQSKCIVPFYEHPYELVVTREGASALLSFYRTSGAKDVVARDRAVPFALLSAQVSGNLDRLHRELSRVNPALAEDAFVVKLAHDARALRQAAGQGTARTLAPHSPKRRYGPGWEAEAKGPLQVSFWLDERDPALRSYCGELRSDLHALLCAGQLRIAGRGLAYTSPAGHPCLLVEEMVEASRRLLTGLDAGESSPHAVAELVREKLLLALEPAGVSLSVPTQDGATRSVIGLEEFLRAVCSGASAFVEAITRVNPLQRENERLRELLLDIEELAQATHEHTRAEVVNPAPTRYQAAARRERSQREPSISPDAGTRRVSFAPHFSLQMDRGSLRAVSAERLFAVGAERLAALDRQRGKTLWESSGRGFALSEDGGFVLGAREGSLRRIDPRTGASLWETYVGGADPAPLGAPLLFSRGGRGRAVIATQDRRILCLDSVTGRLLFSADGPRRGAVHLAQLGRLLYGAGEDGCLLALDVDDGKIVFSQRRRARFSAAPQLCGDRVIFLASGGGEARLVALDAFRGALAWERGLGVSSDAAPTVHGDALLLSARAEDGSRALRVDPRSGEVVWAREMSPGFASSPTVAADYAFWMEDTGILRGFSLDGAGVPLALDLGAPNAKPSAPPPTPVFRGGLLFAAADTVYAVNPTLKQAIGRVIDCPAPPERLFVDSALDVVISADDDYIAAYRLTAKLALVR
jgi:outer membrane protein assembly factor BamB